MPVNKARRGQQTKFDLKFVTITNPKQAKDQALMRNVRRQAMLSHYRKRSHTATTDASSKPLTSPPLPVNPTVSTFQLLGDSLPDLEDVSLFPNDSQALRSWQGPFIGQQVLGEPSTTSHVEIAMLMPPLLSPKSWMSNPSADLSWSTGPAYSTDELVQHAINFYMPIPLNRQHLNKQLDIERICHDRLTSYPTCLRPVYNQNGSLNVSLTLEKEVLRRLHMPYKGMGCGLLSWVHVWQLLNEVVVDDEDILAFQEAGIKKVLECSETRTATQWLALMSYMAGIFREVQPPYMFLSVPPFSLNNSLPIERTDQTSRIKLAGAYPEGCGRTVLSVAQSDRCSTSTYSLISDIRSTTNALLNLHFSDAVCPATTAHTSFPTQTAADVQSQLVSLHERVSALPSASDPHSAVHDDWIFESLRLSALIYTTALAYRVPFSAALNLASTDPLAPPLTRALLVSLRRSGADTDNWGDMALILQWVCTICGAAAKADPDDGVRRTLVRTALRAGMRAVSAFGTPGAFEEYVVSLRRFLAVQEIIGRGWEAWSDMG